MALESTKKLAANSNGAAGGPRCISGVSQVYFSSPAAPPCEIPRRIRFPRCISGASGPFPAEMKLGSPPPPPCDRPESPSFAKLFHSQGHFISFRGSQRVGGEMPPFFLRGGRQGNTRRSNNGKVHVRLELRGPIKAVLRPRGEKTLPAWLRRSYLRVSYFPSGT